MKNIVLVIDWQKIYIRCGENPSRYKGQAVQNTADIIESARKNGDQIAWIAFTKSDDIFDPSRSDGVIPELAALHRDNDAVFTKMKSDAFSNADFEKWLRAQKFDRLIFTGFSMFDCVKATLSGAIERGYGDKCVVPRDACGPGPTKNANISHVFRQLADYHGGQAVSTARLTRAITDNRPVAKSVPYQDMAQPRDKACDKIWTSAEEINFDMYLKMGITGQQKLSDNLVTAWAGNANIDKSLLDDLFNTKEDVIFSAAHFTIMQKLTADIIRAAPKLRK